MEQEPNPTERAEHHFVMPVVTERIRRIDFRYLEGLASLPDNTFKENDQAEAE